MSRPSAPPGLRLALRGAALGLAAGGLAAGATVPPGDGGMMRPAWPAPPAAPRVQYLAHFSSSRDVVPERGAFARLVLGDRGPEDALVKPYGVALAGGVLRVCDTKRDLVNLFDLERGRFGYLGFEGPGRLRKPINLAVDADGTTWVADAARGELVVFDREGGYLGAVGTDALVRPVDVALARDRVWVVDAETCEIVVFDRATRAEVARLGGKGAEPGRFARPTNLAIGPDGTIWVTDTLNGRVQGMAPDGTVRAVLGGLGTGHGQFARPKGIAVDREGRVWVVDAAFENVQVFDPDGRLLTFFPAGESGAGRLELPAQIALDTENVSLFADRANPGFTVEMLVLVTSQYGPRKVTVYGFGRGADVPARGEARAAESGP